MDVSVGSKTILALIYLALILVAEKRVDATIGVNWGRESAQRLIPSAVVDLLLQNGVKEARVYTSRDDLLQAFAGSGIGLTLTVNELFVLDSYDKCKAWVRNKMLNLRMATVRRIYIGSYPFSTGLRNKDTLKTSMDVLLYLQTALNDAGLGDQVKASFTHTSELLKPNMTKPSEAEFRDEIKEEVKTMLRFFEQNGSPFVFDIVPSFLTQAYNMDPLFAFVGESTQVIKDINGAVYTNIFEFAYDSFVWALIKLNASNVKVMVGQIGWPTDGYTNGNASTAERFYKGLLPYVASHKGTPLRPGAPIDTFVHALTDENRLPHQFMRHWGIYRSNGKPKFKIDLTGQGRNIYPTSAKGIMRMPERWCVFNGNQTDYMKVMEQLDFACTKSDCSSLRTGGSCSHLSFEKNVSYAFNTFFQFQFQNEKACDFDGLSYITVDNPSTDECMFPVEVVAGRQENYVQTGRQLNYKVSKGVLHYTPNCVVPLFLLSILGALFWN
ncbi:hypothetical protein C2S52_010892 [Perilla frutescens var. hirtella]|nr:hypothetical protein C2S52_010892 [Perilla frutescens var. hirtella]KAH6817706.1 hypothetical protein C2S51_001309 [Perilla frutescens var. frutescens]